MSDPLAKAKALQAASEERARVRSENEIKRRTELRGAFPVVSEVYDEVVRVFGSAKVQAAEENGKLVYVCRGCGWFVESGARWIGGRDVVTPERCGAKSATFPKTCDQFLWERP